VRDSLECRCSLESCPSTLEEAEQTLCAVTTPEAAVQRLVGCGMVAVADRNGYSGYAWVFERPSASGDVGPPASRLVGASKFSDAVSFDACETSSWEAGRDFFAECAAEVVACSSAATLRALTIRPASSGRQGAVVFVSRRRRR
jgi:hypothetical protein